MVEEGEIHGDWEMVEAEPRPPTPPTPCLPFSPADIHMGIEQLEVQDEEEEDGPPPGWNFIPQLQSNKGDENMDDDEEGPPPGWDFKPKPEQLTEHENKDIKEAEQPPDWHFVSLQEPEIGSHHDDIEEGPPPGWPSVLPAQQNMMAEKQESKVGSELGSHSVHSPQIRTRSELEALKAKEIGIQHGKSSIDLLQPIVEYKQDTEEAQPGLNSILLPQPQVTSPMVPPSPLQLSDRKSEQEVADEEEPPPGWNSTEKNKFNSEHKDTKEGETRVRTSPAKTEIELEKQDILEGADEERAPPGWYSIDKDIISCEHQDIKDGASLSSTSSAKLEIKIEKQDIIDEGPPPGWNLMPPPQSKSGSENQAIKGEGPSRGLHLGPPPPKLDSIQQEIGEERPQSMSNSLCQQSKVGHRQQEVKEERPHPGSNCMPPPSPQIRPPMPVNPMSTSARRPPPSGNHSEMGQMVCGSCRRLLSYTRGAKYVKCSCCQTVNLVLEAHQVGQVKCGGCEVLLMYQFGANAVQCASCRHLTEIVAQNRRPPLSVQQAHGRRHGISNR
nr:PREDICTED: uncharacterized protein LOC108200082 isoform X2 [Daucus carota subsp. sativus]